MAFLQQLIAYPLSFIMWAAYELVHNYGVAIILFTIVTRLIQFPLNLSQQRKTAQMAVFNPMVTDIRKKYANNTQKQNEELMKLQQEYGYKPMAGCMPMLIQFVVMIGLIDVVYKPLTYILRLPADVIQKATEVAKTLPTFTDRAYAVQLSVQQTIASNQGSFTEVLSPDQIQAVSNLNFNFFGLDLTQVPTLAFNLLLIIPILTVLTGLISQFYSMKRSGQMAAGGGAMIGTLIFSNFLMVWFAFQVPAGVSIYWIVGNIWSIPQAWVLGKIHDPDKIKRETEEKIAEARKNANKKKKKAVPKKKVKVEKDGKEIEKELSEKEYYKLRMAKARELDDQKYAEDFSEPKPEEVKKDKEEPETTENKEKQKEE